MDSFGLFEAKSRLSELVERAAKGERIQITRRGVTVAVLGPPAAEARWSPEDAAARIRELRRGTRLEGTTLRDLIDEGRR